MPFSKITIESNSQNSTDSMPKGDFIESTLENTAKNTAQSALNSARAERARALNFKNNALFFTKLKLLENLQTSELCGIKGDFNGEYIKIFAPNLTQSQKLVWEVARALCPWKKGPFSLYFGANCGQNLTPDSIDFGFKIESEWNSAIKFELIKSALCDIFSTFIKENLSPQKNAEKTQKHFKILDLGCNNGYYILRILGLWDDLCADFSQKDSIKDSIESKNSAQDIQNKIQIIGFDPIAYCAAQWEFISFFAPQKRANFELLGLEDLEAFCAVNGGFNMILCLGILYHRRDVLGAIKEVYNALNNGGVAIFDSIIIQGEGEFALCPKERYAKMKNVFFIPTLGAFEAWLTKCGFKKIKLLATLKTDTSEQRKSAWSGEESLQDFLSEDENFTIEGYPAPHRAYFLAQK